jgi:hypothetical protein
MDNPTLHRVPPPVWNRPEAYADLDGQPRQVVIGGGTAWQSFRYLLADIAEFIGIIGRRSLAWLTANWAAVVLGVAFGLCLIAVPAIVVVRVL